MATGTLKERNTADQPFIYSNTNKRYHTYSFDLIRRFGEKCAKLSLDAGFSCPNRDGTCGRDGCIFCSPRGSGDFTSGSERSISEQIRLQKEVYRRKWKVRKFIAYFQAYTNTYAPVDVLKSVFDEALSAEGIVGLNVATRPDCLPDDVLALLADLAERTSLTVELGLQSSNDKTAEGIRQGHTFSDFCNGMMRLRAASPRIRIGVHLIFGLPGEGDAEMLQTVRDTATLRPDEVKIHLLHVLKNTQMEELYQKGAYQPIERERYVRLLADALELLPPETVIGRLTGDGKKEDLIAPLWSRNKITILNDVDKLLSARNSHQGKKWSGAERLPSEGAELLSGRVEG